MVRVVVATVVATVVPETTVEVVVETVIEGGRDVGGIGVGGTGVAVGNKVSVVSGVGVGRGVLISVAVSVGKGKGVAVGTTTVVASAATCDVICPEPTVTSLSLQALSNRLSSTNTAPSEFLGLNLRVIDPQSNLSKVE